MVCNFIFDCVTVKTENIEEEHCVTTLKTAAKLMTKVGYIVGVFFLHGYL